MFEFDTHGDHYIEKKRSRKPLKCKEFSPRNQCHIIGGLVAAAASIGGSLLNRKSADDAKDANMTIAANNLALQRELLDKQLEFTREENALQRAVADRILNIQLAGTTDARGNRTFFKEGEGFVSRIVTGKL